MLSALHAHTKAPYKPNLLWKTLRALNRPDHCRGPDSGLAGGLPGGDASGPLSGDEGATSWVNPVNCTFTAYGGSHCQFCWHSTGL
jgi:hypothetical protein